MPVEKQLMWEPCNFLEDDEDDFDEDDDKYNDGYEEGGGVMKILAMRHEDVVVTPFGPINLSDSSSPIHNTKFFVGHSNFNLSKKVILAINNTVGVEFLKVISRYRFLIGIGLMFQPLNVQEQIEQALEIPNTRDKEVDDELSRIEDLDGDDEDEDEENVEVTNVIDEILNTVSKDSKWIAYVFPNGEHIIKIATNDEEFAQKKTEFEELALLSNGHVMCHND